MVRYAGNLRPSPFQQKLPSVVRVTSPNFFHLLVGALLVKRIFRDILHVRWKILTYDRVGVVVSYERIST